MLFSVLEPIVSYEIKSNREYPILLNPVVGDKSDIAGTEVGADLTKASSWFAGSDAGFVSDSVKYFTLSIPKLDIKKATVAIGGEDLSESLIQFPGTALPGKIGNSVIFGHSILPIYYDPENYLAIFSTLPTLVEEDEVVVNYDGITYTYEVESVFEVLPTDVQVLDQNSNGSYLTLITCTPPGHPQKPRRLIVRAKIVPFQQANASIGN